MSEAERIRKLTGMSRTSFCKKYRIPLRTYEQWEAEQRHPPKYVLYLLEIVVNYDLKTKQ